MAQCSPLLRPTTRCACCRRTSCAGKHLHARLTSAFATTRLHRACPAYCAPDSSVIVRPCSLYHRLADSCRNSLSLSPSPSPARLPARAHTFLKKGAEHYMLLSHVISFPPAFHLLSHRLPTSPHYYSPILSQMQHISKPNNSTLSRARLNLFSYRNVFTHLHALPYIPPAYNRVLSLSLPVPSLNSNALSHSSAHRLCTPQISLLTNPKDHLPLCNILLAPQPLLAHACLFLCSHVKQFSSCPPNAFCLQKLNILSHTHPVPSSSLFFVLSIPNPHKYLIHMPFTFLPLIYTARFPSPTSHSSPST